MLVCLYYSSAGAVLAPPIDRPFWSACILLVQVATAKPHEQLSDDMWMTVLVLAYLKKHLAAERGCWEGMEVKACAWLQERWPHAAGTVGGAVLNAMRQL